MEPGTLLHRVFEMPPSNGLDFSEAVEPLFAADALAAVDAVFSFCFAGQQNMVRLR